MTALMEMMKITAVSKCAFAIHFLSLDLIRVKLAMYAELHFQKDWNYCFLGNKCPFKHRCLDGSCIAWSETCIREPFCKDGTNTPSVCGK